MSAAWWQRDDRGPTSAELRAHALSMAEPADEPTNHARVECEGCGEYVYTVSRGGVGPAHFPKTCPKCGAAVVV